MTQNTLRPWITALSAGKGEGKSAMLVSNRLFQLVSVESNKDLQYVAITKDESAFRGLMEKGFKHLNLSQGTTVIAPEVRFVDFKSIDIANAIASLHNRSVLIVDPIEEVQSIYPLEDRVLNADINCLEIIITSEHKTI